MARKVYADPMTYQQERQERYIKRRVRKNSFAAGCFFVLALFFFVIMVFGAYVYWTTDFLTTDDGGLSQVAFILPLSREQATVNDYAKYLSTGFALFACNFFACLALRRGEEKRVKGFWLFLYLVGTLAVLALYFFYNVQSVCNGDIQLWISDLQSFTVHATYWYAAVALALICLVAFICAHNSGLFAGKTDLVKRKENGKLHGGVCLTYLLTSVFNYFIVIVFCIYLIIRRIVKSATRDDDDYDMASEEILFNPTQPNVNQPTAGNGAGRRIGGR